jgi:hypothetical protein
LYLNFDSLISNLLSVRCVGGEKQTSCESINHDDKTTHKNALKLEHIEENTTKLTQSWCAAGRTTTTITKNTNQTIEDHDDKRGQLVAIGDGVVSGQS